MVIKYTLKNVGSAPTSPRRLPRCTVSGLLPAVLLAPPLAFPGGTGGTGETAVAVKRLVKPGAESWPSVFDWTLRNWQEYFSGDFPSTQRGVRTLRSRIPSFREKVHSSPCVQSSCPPPPPILPHHLAEGV